MKLPPMRPAADSVEEITDSALVPTETRGQGVVLPVPAPVDSSADVTAERRPVTEISSSSLVADPSGNTQLPTVLIAPDPPLPPSPAPVPEDLQDELVLPASPAERVVAAARGTLAFARRVAADLRVILEKPEHKWTVAALAFGGVLFMVSMTAIVVGLSKGSGEPSKAVTGASPSAGIDKSIPSLSSTSTPWAPVDPTRGAPRSSAPSREPCGVAGGPHVIAPKAIVISGVEAVASQDKLALGFAVGPKDGMAVEVEGPSLAVSVTARTRAKETIRRLVPLVAGDRLGAAADIDHKGARLQGAHTIPSESPFVIGTSDGQLAWAAHATDDPVPLWPLLSDAPVEALRGVSLGDSGYALAFRQDGAIWLGALTAGKTANGLLSKVASLGPTVGSPTLAVSDDNVLVAWADRADATEPWGVRWLTWKPGNPPSAAQSFAIPAGGLGEQAMSPALAGMSGGRFLMVWTEGPVASHQVRALTLSSDGTALGSPLTISAEGVNAGQGQAAILADGRGVVAFLASDGTGFEVVANPVVCPAGAM
jgi:hypothetical protein